MPETGDTASLSAIVVTDNVNISSEDTEVQNEHYRLFYDFYYYYYLIIDFSNTFPVLKSNLGQNLGQGQFVSLEPMKLKPFRR